MTVILVYNSDEKVDTKLVALADVVVRNGVVMKAILPGVRL